MTRPLLHRTTPAPPVRIVHFGLGAFSRSHTAWYTHASVDGAEWGIAAYTGRSRELADRLEAQDGLYTLIQRDEVTDHAEVIGSIVRAHAGDDLAALIADLSASRTAIVTLTITEAGYRLRGGYEPDLDDPLVARDVDELRDVAAGRLAVAEAHPATVPGRLLLGLEARRRIGGGPLAVLSCDNLPDNGGRLARGLTAWAGLAAPQLRDWVEAHVSFVSSSVDRITPRISDEESQALRGEYGDQAPVVAEPFHDWVLSGDFPAGRPRWETAGARFVAELEPWAARKLWLLNGAHTLLASLGLLREHRTVSAAIADPVCREAVESLWNDAEAALPSGMQIAEYRAALVRRFANPRIEHLLEQIAQHSRTKVALRLVPVAEIERSRGRDADGYALALAAWIVAGADGMLPSHRDVDGTRSAASRIVTSLSAALGADRPFVARIDDAIATLRV